MPRPRLDHLDALRGFALCGILIIHCVFLGGSDVVAFAVPAGTSERIDRLVSGLVIALVESKFFCLFTLLFGVGFALQQPAVRMPGVGRRFPRRLLTLSAFGVLHILLVWDGDVLLAYSLVGWLLIPFRKCRPKTLVWWAVGLIAVPLPFYLLLLGAVELSRLTPEGATALAKVDGDVLAELAKETANPPTPTYLGVMAHRLAEYPNIVLMLVSRVPTMLAMFLLGLAAERSGIVADPLGHRRKLVWLAAVGLLVGLPICGLIGWGFATRPVISAICWFLMNQAIGGPVLAVGYAATATLVFSRWAPRPLVALGRMGLTNYIGHSVLLYLLFSPDTLALKGKVSAVGLIGVAAGVAAVLSGFSLLWLRRYRFGPLEYLWRAATYREWPVMRKPVDP